MLLLWLLATLLSSTTTESAQPQRRPPLYDLLTIQHHTTCVVTAGFNVEATIGESTRSVIQQRDVHLVFVDDGSSDDSVCAFRAAAGATSATLVALRSNSLGGVGTAANAGLDACPVNSTYIAFLDADDVMVPGAVKRLVAIAEATGADVVVGSWFRQEQDTGRRREPYDKHHTSKLPRDEPFHPKDHPRVVRMSPVPWRKLYRSSALRARFPTGDYYYEDNVFHWAVLLSAETVVYTDVPVVAHTVNGPDQTTAFTADASKAARLADHLPNLRRIAALVLQDKEPWAVEEFVDFVSRSKWIATRQGDPRLRAKFARVLARDANAFVDAASQDEATRRALRVRFEQKYVFFTKEQQPAPELSVVIPAFDVKDKVLALVAKLRTLELDLEVFVVDDGSADGAADALEALGWDDLYVLRQGGAPRGAGRARNRALPLLEGDFVAYIDAGIAFAPGAFARAVGALRGRPELDLLFLPYGGAGADDRAAWARGARAPEAAARRAAALHLASHPWNRLGRRGALEDVWFGTARGHDDVRFHWTSIAAARDVGFHESAAPVVWRDGLPKTPAAALGFFDALAETERALGECHHFRRWGAFYNFAKNLVVWAAPRIPPESVLKAKSRCVEALGDLPFCSRYFGASPAPARAGCEKSAWGTTVGVASSHTPPKRPSTRGGMLGPEYCGHRPGVICRGDGPQKRCWPDDACRQKVPRSRSHRVGRM